MTTVPTFDEPCEPAAPSAAATLPAKPANRSLGRPGWIVLTPFVVGFVYSALLTFKPTRAFALQMADENYPIEMATFALLLAGGIYGVRMALRARRRGLLALWTLFYLTFSVFLLLTGMEEISWGQWFFHFHTPEAIARINTQQEFTLHNLNGLGGHTVWLRLAFGVGGLVGMALWLVRMFRPVAVPPMLWAWFVVITVFAVGDLVSDYVGPRPVAALFDVMSEVNELLIAAAGCLYLWFKSKELLGTSSTP
jgi:hypothetical protein